MHPNRLLHFCMRQAVESGLVFHAPSQFFETCVAFLGSFTSATIRLKNARDVYTRRKEGQSIWVVEAKHITASVPDKKGPLFDPSDSKVYRHPGFFKIPDEVGPM